MTGSAVVALDVGASVTKVAVTGPDGEPRSHSMVTAAGSCRAALSAALAAARADLGSAPGSVCFAVPDFWLSADPAGGRAFEEFRHVAEDKLGLGGLSWAGQGVAVTAAVASQQPTAGNGRYLVCDVGARGVRAAVCELAGQEVRLVTAVATERDGAADFAARAAGAAGAHDDPGLGDWLTAIRSQPRLAVTLERAAVDRAFLATPACTLTGARSYRLTAGQLADSFAPTAQALTVGVEAVLGGDRPAVAVLTGGLGWFPLAGKAVAAAAGRAPVLAEAAAAAAGALLLGQGQLREAAASLPPVTLPARQIRNGLLEAAHLIVPWSRSFAPIDGGPISCDSDVLELDIAGRPRSARLPGIRPGRYQIGVRPAHPGRGLLVLRAASPREAVHIAAIDLEQTS